MFMNKLHAVIARIVLFSIKKIPQKENPKVINPGVTSHFFTTIREPRLISSAAISLEYTCKTIMESNCESVVK